MILEPRNLNETAVSNDFEFIRSKSPHEQRGNTCLLQQYKNTVSGSMHILPSFSKAYWGGAGHFVPRKFTYYRRRAGQRLLTSSDLTACHTPHLEFRH